MFSVALVGPDGCGKTTIGRRLEHALPMPARYIYMGVNLEAGNRMLPTTRLVRLIKRLRGVKPAAGPPHGSGGRAPASGSFVRRAGAGAKAWLGLANRVAEECYRQALARYHQARGRIVVFDRHFLCDYYASDIADTARSRSLRSRVHAFVLQRICGAPDLIILLDAPADVLFRRKGEGTVELLERRREEYLKLRDVVPRFATVDACQAEDEVERDVVRHITALAAAWAGSAAARERH